MDKIIHRLDLLSTTIRRNLKEKFPTQTAYTKALIEDNELRLRVTVVNEHGDITLSMPIFLLTIVPDIAADAKEWVTNYNLRF